MYPDSKIVASDKASRPPFVEERAKFKPLRGQTRPRCMGATGTKGIRVALLPVCATDLGTCRVLCNRWVDIVLHLSRVASRVIESRSPPGPRGVPGTVVELLCGCAGRAPPRL